MHQAHELAGDVAVEPRRAERVLCHQPARREDREVHVAGARCVAGRMQHQEDRRVRVVVTDRADGVEAAQIVAVRRVVAVPGHHVQRRMVDRCAPQAAFELGDQLEVTVHVLECRMRGLEVAWVGQAVGADRAEVGQLQQRAVVLADVAAARAVGQFHPEAHATRDHRDLLRLDLDHAHLGQQAQRAQLGHDQQLAIGVVEIAADHVAVGRVQMDAHTRVRIGRTVATHGVQAFDEVGRQLRQRQRAPAQLVRRGRLCAEITLQLRLRERGELAVGDRRAYPVQPAAAIAAARRGKRGAGQLAPATASVANSLPKPDW
ncbi:hypothetical protein G6F22_015190 [Rhizopus arrhizus]|nr:hypothetical protein G6F22_015190 [Rhizopus arrhizus]